MSDYLLYCLARNWPSPIAYLDDSLEGEPGSDEYNRAYAQHQFDSRVARGILRTVSGLDVLEVGCGHGGICCFMAAVGARSVVGIDVNERDLQFARAFAADFAARRNPPACFPLAFAGMDAGQMGFADAQFDMVLADNVFEHFTDPEGVMRESFRVLRPGGGLLVPVFSSIKSKHGLHLKHGLKLPWANLFFSERTIIRAMYRLAETNPQLYEWYPGLNDHPERVRDLRRHGDLNDITFRSFKAIATRVGFRVERFKAHGTRMGKVAARVPLVRDSILLDIFSTGAAAVLRKPEQMPPVDNNQS